MKKLLILTILFLVFSSSLAFAAFPAIFYSDLESGPNRGGQNNKGAFVTIWGKNFGATQGSGNVSVGGGQADNYPVWSDTKISFQLGPNAATGNITVTTSDGSSNGVPFTVRSGNIYFVKTTGNDANSGNWDTSWRTIRKVRWSLSPGDIVYICDGVSQTTEDDYRACINLDSSGTSDNPKAIVAYPGASVTVGSSSVEKGFGNYISGGGNGRYWVISQVNITAFDRSVPLAYGFRIVGNRITVPGGNAASAAIEGDGSHARILGNELYNCGAANATKLYHNIYINNHTGAEITDIEIGWNTIRDSTANRGIQIYSDGSGSADISDVRIHDNLIYNLRGNGININVHSAGIFQVYNNIIYKAGRGPDPSDGQTIYTGIYIDGNNAMVYLYNNTIYDCGYNGQPNESGLLLIGSWYTGTIYPRNNIFYSNGANYEPYLASGSRLPSQGAYCNLFYGRGSSPSWDTTAVNSDPKFVNLSNYNFHLQEASPAKDAGTNTSAVVLQDFDGVARPQASAFDIGAYEYASEGGGYNPQNSAPVLAPIGNKSANENSSLQFTVTATDADLDLITYSVSGLPAGASFNAATGVFSWTPTYSQAGTYNFTFTASDGNGGTDSETITITVNNVNRAPVLAAIGNKAVNEGVSLRFNVSATDPDGDALTYSVLGLPNGATFLGQTFSWAPAYNQAGTYSLTFTASDGKLADSKTIVITVNNVPDIAISAQASPVSGTVPLTVGFTVSASSRNGSIVRYEWDFEGSGNYVWSSPATGNVSYTYSSAGNYTATVKVTDSLGIQDTYAILIQAQANPSAPTLNVTTDTASGTAPLIIYFKVDASPRTDIAKYEWDFEGDGIYEYKSSKSGNVVKTYSEAGVYLATLKVTNFSAISSTKQVVINVGSNAAAPNISLELAAASKVVPATATFTVKNANSDIVRYEWDFEGDGVFDRSTYNINTLLYTFGHAGTFTPRVRVTNKDGLSATATANITISDNSAFSKPAASFTATPSQGEAPLRINFNNQSTGNIGASYWDFDGNKLYDCATMYLQKSYLYKEPGYYMVNLGVINDKGIFDKASKQIKVIAPNKKIVVISPNDSETVKGTLTLAVYIDPRISVSRVRYQFLALGQANWQDIDSSAVYPYCVTWNTVNLTTGLYSIRAIADDIAPFFSDYITVTVDNLSTNPNSQGGTNISGEFQNQTSIDPTQSQQAYLYDGTQAQIPYQAIDTSDTLTITMSDPAKLTNTLQNSYSNVMDINKYREISLQSNTKLLNRELTLIFPYDDADNDGYVDGTTVKEETLNIYLYDEVSGEWRKLFDCIVRPDENLVEAKTNHLSLFGLAGTKTVVAAATGDGGGGGGGGGGCFIATACYGSKMAQEVRILSAFRDKYLLTNRLGRQAVALYYKISPSIAKYIARNEIAKEVVRAVLKPVLWISKSLLTPSEQP